jgi:hypothetical protein
MKLTKQMKLLKHAFFILAMTYSASSFAYDPYDCINDVAEIDPETPIGLATELCSATWSSEPVKCYLGISLIDEEIPRGLAIELCSGSVSAEKTLECYAKGGTRQLNRGLAITLCGANKSKN